MWRPPLGQLLDKLGVSYRRRGRELVALCPNPGHDDTSPSWRMIDDATSPKHGAHNCFACGFGGGPWELVAAVLGIELEEAGKWIQAEFKSSDDEQSEIPLIRVVASRKRVTYELPPGIQIPSLDGSQWFEPAAKYLRDRGIEDWQIQRWHIGYATTGRCAWRVVVPVHTCGDLVSYVARAFLDDGRARYDVARAVDPGARPHLALFGEPGFDDGDTVTIAEGVFSALALERAGAPNPCAVLGAMNIGAEKIKILSGFKTALVCTDPDDAGDTAHAALDAALGRYVDVRRVRLPHSPDDCSQHELVEALSRAGAFGKPQT